MPETLNKLEHAMPMVRKLTIEVVISGMNIPHSDASQSGIAARS